MNIGWMFKQLDPFKFNVLRINQVLLYLYSSKTENDHLYFQWNNILLVYDKFKLKSKRCITVMRIKKTLLKLIGDILMYIVPAKH